MIYLMVAILTLIAIAIFMLPTMRGWRERVAKQQRSSKQLNIALTQQRLNEINQEAEQNLLDDNHLAQMVNEQKSALLSEVKEDQQAAPIPLKFYLPGVLTLVITSALYFSRDNTEQLAHWWNVQEQLPELAKRAVMLEGEPLSEQETKDFALALRTRLAKDEGDAVGWMLLGRISLSLRDLEQALNAFKRSYQLEPNRVSMLNSYAQALILTGEEADKNRAYQLVTKALSLEPQNLEALAVFALVSNERGETDKALSAWQLLKTGLSESDPRYAAVEQQIAALQTNASSEKGKSIQVTVQLEESLKAKLPEQGYLFVFAKEYQGKPMPLAVVRQPLEQLPISLVLSDQNAMMAELNLSSAEQVTVVARISLDENVDVVSGELQGLVEPLYLQDDNRVTITIDGIL